MVFELAERKVYAMADEAIDKFEKEYIARLKVWCTRIDAEELDGITRTMRRMDLEVKAIGKMQKSASAAERWRKICSQAWSMLPAVQQNLEKLKADSRVNLMMLGKGQRGLMGYRRALPENGGIYDSESQG